MSLARDNVEKLRVLSSTPLIDDISTGTGITWSSNKIQSELDIVLATSSSSTSAPTTNVSTISINENSVGQVTVTNYESGLVYTLATSDSNIATASESSGTIDITTKDITDTVNKQCTISISAKAPGVPISDPRVITVHSIYVPAVADTTIQVVDFTAEASVNTGWTLI